MPNENRGYMAGKFALDLDHAGLSGWLYSAEGGQASAEVVVEKMGPDHYQRKHVGSVKYDDLSIACGVGMNKLFYDWLTRSLNLNFDRHSGAIVTADYNYKVMSRMEFYDALITEIGFPALDAAARDPAKLSVKFTPERTRITPGDGSDLSRYAIREPVKRWLPSNFRLRINGLEKSCARVNKIDAIVIKQKSVESPFNESRDWEREPATLEFPNLVITLPEADAGPFQDWYEDFVIDGNNDQDAERPGTLEFLSSNLREILFSIELRQIGIFKITPDKLEAGSENIRRTKVEMYVEEMHVDFDGKVVIPSS